MALSDSYVKKYQSQKCLLKGGLRVKQHMMVTCLDISSSRKNQSFSGAKSIVYLDVEKGKVEAILEKLDNHIIKRNGKQIALNHYRIWDRNDVLNFLFQTWKHRLVSFFHLNITFSCGLSLTQRTLSFTLRRTDGKSLLLWQNF